MTEYPKLTKEQVREYADNFLRWLDDNPGKVPADDWKAWRITFPTPYPFDRKTGERQIREFLVLNDCITNPTDAYIRIVELLPNGRKALDFPGGPLAYWKRQDEAEELRHKSLQKSAKPEHWFWLGWERAKGLWPIPAALVAILALWSQAPKCGSQSHSPGQEAARPASGQPSAPDSQASQLASPTDTLSNSSSSGLSP